MESLRLTHPLTQLVKLSGPCARTIVLPSRTVTVPAGTNIHLSLCAMHTHPDYWGSSSLTFQPERFISHPQTNSQFHTMEDEVVAPDTSAHFFPWAYGQRICPGKKFSQVELVAAVAVMFWDYRVDPVPQSGETMQDARRRLFATGLEVDHEGKMLFEMANPETTRLVWSRRMSE
jgi:cytochrome P450